MSKYKVPHPQSEAWTHYQNGVSTGEKIGYDRAIKDVVKFIRTTKERLPLLERFGWLGVFADQLAEKIESGDWRQTK